MHSLKEEVFEKIHGYNQDRFNYLRKTVMFKVIINLDLCCTHAAKFFSGQIQWHSFCNSTFNEKQERINHESNFW